MNATNISERTEKKAEVVTPQTVAQIMNATLKANPDGGEVDLDYLEKTLKLDRHGLLEQCRELPKQFCLVFGRKGGKSRICFGNKVPAHMTTKKHNSPRIVRKHENKEVAPTNQIHMPRLQIRIGDTIQMVDIGLELVA